MVQTPALFGLFTQDVGVASVSLKNGQHLLRKMSIDPEAPDAEGYRRTPYHSEIKFDPEALIVDL